MFEKEIKFIIDFTLNRINRLGSFFNFEKLAAAEVHPAIIQYISAQLDYLIYEDRKKLLQNSSFDYSGSEIAKYFGLIGEEIKKNKRLAFEDVKTLVTHAVTFNVNYLVRPNWTLLKLIFNEQKSRNVNEIRMMLNYVYYYDYVKNVFLGYFSKRKILSLSETEFENILVKIDNQMFNEHTRDLIDNALVSIGDFFNEGGLNKTQVSPQTVEFFLKEKNLNEGLFKLKRSIPSEDKQKYNIDEIRKIIYSKETQKVEKEAEKIEEKKGITPLNRAEEMDDKTSSEDESLLDESSLKEIPRYEPEMEHKTDEILNESEGTIVKSESAGEEIHTGSDSAADDDFFSRYQSELKSLEELEASLTSNDKEEGFPFNEPEEIKQPEKPETADEVKDQNKSELLTFDEIMSVKKDTIDTVQDDDEAPSEELVIEEEEFTPFEKEEVKQEVPITPVKKKNDILGFLTDKEMERIVSNVFNEDEEDFVSTMEKISDCSNYEDATEILKLVFLSYKINPYSRDAVTLTNAVSNYFDQDK
jgi:hypothetical protein